ncbi:alanine racemase [Halalkalibacillus sediminis]|uniref:Alanine racemase n=1 Tax=Halalkalibacillus sediminis TaxID=2018042 RepID=A0A2I0QRQ4_9BACI|nr:alanine racemase [Halalkalibacillus sediminis]PKR77012.1 alanine racemase [Halalkalibacillus sediminis]
MTTEPFYRDTWAEVDLSAIRNNVKVLHDHYNGEKKIYAAVKADAYGHGEIEVAEAALEAGADALAVAILDEAIRLRMYFKDIPILVMGWIRPEDAPVAARNRIIATAFQSEWIRAASEYLKDEKLDIHLKIDSGMGRIGIRTFEEAYDVIKEVNDSSLNITGVFTHFSTADETDDSYYKVQLERFRGLYSKLKAYLPETVEVHTGNTAAAFRYPEDTFDGVRFGIGMYGLYPSEDVASATRKPLIQAFSLHTELIHVKKVSEDEGISYGATYRTTDNEWIGTIPIGYGDGWIRKLQNFEVLIEGEFVPIVGRICMDQCMIRLPREYPVGTRVTLIGRSRDQEVTVDDIATYLETINYEIPCMFNRRIPRIYRK